MSRNPDRNLVGFLPCLATPRLRTRPAARSIDHNSGETTNPFVPRAGRHRRQVEPQWDHRRRRHHWTDIPDPELAAELRVSRYSRSLVGMECAISHDT